MIDPVALTQAIVTLRAAGKRVKFLYTIPNFQNPTGVTQTLERRRELIALAHEFDLLIVEDDRARRRANLPPKDLQITLTKVYRDGATTPSTMTFRNLVMTVGTQIGSRTDDVKRPLKWAAGDRAFTG